MKKQKTFLLYIRKYNPFTNDYELTIKRVKTDNIYRIIGKIYSTTFVKIDRIDYNISIPESEKFWVNKGYTITDYIEPKLCLE